MTKENTHQNEITQFARGRFHHRCGIKTDKNVNNEKTDDDPNTSDETDDDG